MVKMNNTMITLCSLAIGSIYVTGFTMTEPSHAATTTALKQKVEVNVPLVSTKKQENASATSSSVPKQATSQKKTASSKGSGSVAQTPHSTLEKTTKKASTESSGSTNSKTKSNATTKQATVTPPTSPPKKTQTAPAKPVATPANKIYKDGTFTGLGSAWNGTVQVAVTTKQDKIVSVQITNCTTSYSESNIASLPQEVVSKQSTNIDLVSGATVSSEDFQQAVQQALGKAKV